MLAGLALTSWAPLDLLLLLDVSDTVVTVPQARVLKLFWLP